MTRRVLMKLWKATTQTVFKARFNHIGKGTTIYHPMEIEAPKSISIGNNVIIEEFAWLMANKSRKVSLKIDDGVRIGHFAHIIALDSIKVEKDVLIADRVFISDCTHLYKDIHTPVIDQGILTTGEIIIGEGSWIGENVCVCGANIGKHCVVGANAVVIKDIPDYSVVAGNPAKIIKKYNFQKQEWEKV